MKPPKTLKHEFVEFIPDVIEEGKIFVSIKYATAVHKCCCGCGKEVVTPLSLQVARRSQSAAIQSLHPCH